MPTIIENKAVLFKTRTPAKITSVIPQAGLLSPVPGTDIANVLVNFTHENMRVLCNLKFKDVPSPMRVNYTYPGMFTPYSHQRVTSEFLSLHKRAFCLNDVGTGKTSSALWAADYLMNEGIVKRALVICPFSTMRAAWVDEVCKTVIHRTVDVAHGTRAERKKVIQGKTDFVVINHDGVKLMTQELIDAQFDLIIYDECFPAGTRIATPDGGKNIEHCNIGDIVYTSAGARPITRTFCKSTNELVILELSNGQRIECTPNHPIFTDRGWLRADVCAARYLCHTSTLRSLSAGVQRSDIDIFVWPTPRNSTGDELFASLRRETQVSTKPGEMVTTGTECKSASVTTQQQRVQMAPGSSGTVKRCVAENTAPPSGTGRKWNWFSAVRKVVANCITNYIYMELFDKIKNCLATRISAQLQSRFWRSTAKNSYRSGRKQPQLTQPTGAGPQERNQIERIRVDRVTYKKSDSPQNVYNIEIADCPHYFADGILVHNCTAIKDAHSDRWKATHALIQPTTWAWLMSGTPVPQRPTDAYGPMKLIVPENCPRYFTGWKEATMKKINQFKWVPKHDAPAIIHAAMQPAIRFEKKDCIDLPPVTYEVRDVEMTAQQQKYYNKLREEMVIELKGANITAVNAAVLLTKLLQVAAGAAIASDDAHVHFDISSRLKVIRELIEEASGKVLIAVPYLAAMHRLADELKKDYSLELIYGDVGDRKRYDIFTRFQNSADPELLIIQPAAAAHGVTLTEADTIIWYSPTTRFEIYEQFNARINRPGQVRKMTVHLLQSCAAERQLNTALRVMGGQHLDLMDLYKRVVA